MASEYIGRLQALAERVSRAPDFFGAILSEFASQEKLTRDDLMGRLRTTPAMFARLELCRRPDSLSSEFASQIRQIAAFTEINSDLLIAMLRQVEAIESLSTRNKITRLAYHRPNSATGAGLLAAARDRENSKERSNERTKESSEDKRQ